MHLLPLAVLTEVLQVRQVEGELDSGCLTPERAQHVLAQVEAR